MDSKTRNSLIVAVVCVLLIAGVSAMVYTFQKDATPGPVSTDADIDTTDRVMAEDYIREHIDELSPVSPTLGGQFTVTRIDWRDNGEVLVTYEDGHEQYQASADVAVSDAAVTVLNFQLLDENAMETYTNSTYGYAVQFPAWWDIHTYSADSSTIGTERNEVVDGQVEIQVITQEFGATEEDIERQLLNSCAADGPTGSIECTGIANENAFQTSAGVSGKRYILTERVANFESSQTTTHMRGPYFTFALSNGNTLLIRPAANKTSEEIDTALVIDVADSVELTSVSSASSVSTLSSSSVISASSTPSVTSSSSLSGRPLAKEGEFCGGIAGIQCETGLTCVYEGTYPDAGGTCENQ